MTFLWIASGVSTKVVDSHKSTEGPNPSPKWEEMMRDYVMHEHIQKLTELFLETLEQVPPDHLKASSAYIQAMADRFQQLSKEVSQC